MEPRVVRLSYKIEKDKLKELARNTLIFQFILERYKDVRKFGSVLENTQYGFNASASEKGNVRLLRITDLKDSGVRWEDVPFCQYENPEKHILKDKDILIARTGTIGKSFLVEGKIPDNTVFASYLIRLSPKKDILESEYAYLFLNSYYFWPQILEMKAGTAKININAEKIKSVDFPYCPLNIQKEIIGVDFVRKYPELDDKIQNMLGLIDQVYDFERLSDDCTNLLSRLRSSILQDAIQGKLVPQDPTDEPAAVLLERIRKEKEYLAKAGKIKKQKELPPISQEEIPFELPDGWEWTRLGNVLSYVQRGPSAIYSESSNVEIINQKCIQWRGLDLSATKHYNEDLIAKLDENRFIRSEDLLLNSTGTGTIGRCLLIDQIRAGKYIADSHVTILRSLISNHYIELFLKTPEIQGLINGVGGSTNQIELSKGTIEAFAIPIPPLAEQYRIISKVTELMAECDVLESITSESSERSEKLLESVLGKAFHK